MGEHGTPIPKLENEMKAVGSGPVVTYKLSPEELEKYGPVRPYTEKKPVMLEHDLSPEVQSRRAKTRWEKRNTKYAHITKEFILAEFEKGKTAAQIEQEQGMAKNAIYIKMRQFGIKSPNKPGQPRKETTERTTPPAQQEQSDLVNAPPHYTTGGIETIDFIQAKLTEEQFIGFCVGNVLKYCSRHQHKGGLEDLKKARWYLDRLVQGIET